MESIFTIYFESPFWVGILERYDEDGYWLGKHTFGGEPTNAELWEFAKTEFSQMRIVLVRESDQPVTSVVKNKPKSIKKAQRDARKDLTRGFSSCTHAAMQEQLTTIKAERFQELKERIEQREQEQYLIKQRKKKEKHKGH